MTKTIAILGMQINSLLPNESREVKVKIMRKLSEKNIIPDDVQKKKNSQYIFSSKKGNIVINI